MYVRYRNFDIFDDVTISFIKMRVKYGVRYYRSLKILNIYGYFCINMYDMNDFVYLCIGFSYVKIGILARGA